MIRTFFSLTGLILLLANSYSQDWQELFNGKNLKGWKILDGTAEYVVEDGVIVGTCQTGTPNKFLATKKTYGDFTLEYERKRDRGINSGVQIRSVTHLPDGRERVNGYQIECDDHDHRPWAGGVYHEAHRGWLYPLTYNPDATKHNHRGEWNKIRVEALGNNIRTYVNGVGFANLLDEGEKEGFIALQVHNIPRDGKLAGKQIRWRNIRILTEDVEKYRWPEEKAAPELNLLSNVLSPLQKEEGWEFLWDGKTPEGWKGAKLDQFPEQGWTIGNGILKVEGSGGGDIITQDVFGDFILEVDFKITKGANSGVKYFVDPELIREGTVIGCEFQVIDDKDFRLPDGAELRDKQKMGSLYDLVAPDASLYGIDDVPVRFMGVGNWNRLRIEVRGSKVVHILNGAKVVEYERGTQMWKALVATSKFRVWPGFGEVKMGHILLQDHGGEVEFKNIKIREL